MQVNTAITATNPRRCNKKKERHKYTMPGACFSKVPKLFGRISDDIILFVSSKRRRIEARNFAVILIFIPFPTYEKTSFTEKAGRFTNSFSGPKSSRDFRETCPWSQTFYERKKSRIKTNPSFVGFYSNFFPQFILHPPLIPLACSSNYL